MRGFGWLDFVTSIKGFAPLVNVYAEHQHRFPLPKNIHEFSGQRIADWFDFAVFWNRYKRPIRREPAAYCWKFTYSIFLSI